MILGIICFILFISGLILIDLFLNENTLFYNSITLFIAGLITTVIGFIGIILFCVINANILLNWFKI